MKILVVCPHFAPDTAPTGTVMTRIVSELALHGHELHVVTSLPWYRTHSLEPGWGGRLIRRQRTPWGSITRVHPFPGADKRNLVRRAAGFAGFSALAGLAALGAGRPVRGVDAVLAMSPPLTLGPTGWLVGVLRRAPLVFNIQDVFPDAAIRSGAIRNRHVIAALAWLERCSYRRAAAITVLSEGLRRNVAAKLPAADAGRVRVIPNFVDTAAIVPADRATSYRRQLGIGDEPVVLYAGNVGFSQSLDLVLAAARVCPLAVFVINGDGAARAELERAAADLPNIRFSGYQPAERLAEVLATGDVHVVPLKAGLGDVSVPSKAYSSLAAARPIVASIDPGSEIPRLLDEAGAGVSVAPDDPGAFAAAISELIADAERRRRLGESGRAWVERHAAPAAVGAAYHELLVDVAARHRRRRRWWGAARRDRAGTDSLPGRG